MARVEVSEAASSTVRAVVGRGLSSAAVAAATASASVKVATATREASDVGVGDSGLGERDGGLRLREG